MRKGLLLGNHLLLGQSLLLLLGLHLGDSLLMQRLGLKNGLLLLLLLLLLHEHLLVMVCVSHQWDG